ncbi:ankyrin repeat domain-containing protein [Cohnella phaseoli]|uniref:Ankyrin repeat protein n=1 Tax=Cohnella phaseoli TaxID=456490 RepID=A0A3D9JRR7_9BACL|nr:ankyrin repeat domain-containing protein [Cohnella phaseoli]RED76718.1 ankyrin repeat protein [Cohnella phaseoli]
MAKRKTLPKDFDALIEKKDIEALKAVFRKCELDAYSGNYMKEPALSCFNIPDEWVRWLVEQGANINAVDAYGRAPLHAHSMRMSGDVEVFLKLGADVELKDKYGDTPLHMAAGSANFRCVQQLVNHGANIRAVNDSRMTPLDKALINGGNIHLANLAKISDLLLSKGVETTETMRAAVTRLGENFEFHRANFNKDMFAETEEGLYRLYELFAVEPVARRQMHDGKAPILLQKQNWKENFSDLWALLVPSSGSAQTAQGEVVRIAGKVRDEIFRNGGGNWGPYFKKMLDKYKEVLAAGNPLPSELLEEAGLVVDKVRRSGDGDEELNRLCEWAVIWVRQNPDPLPLGKTDY